MKLSGYLLIAVYLFSFNWSKLDIVCAVRVYFLAHSLSVNLIVFMQLHWFWTGLIYASIPFLYWVSLSDHLDKELEGFATQMCWVQIQVVFYVMLLAYQVRKNAIELFI